MLKVSGYLPPKTSYNTQKWNLAIIIHQKGPQEISENFRRIQLSLFLQHKQQCLRSYNGFIGLCTNFCWTQQRIFNFTKRRTFSWSDSKYKILKEQRAMWN